MTEYPFCTQCGKSRPVGREETHCVPCANTGHDFRLVVDEEDAKRRVLSWLDHYTRHEYSSKDVASIHSWKRLVAACCDQKLFHCLTGTPVVVGESTLAEWEWVADYVRTCRNRRQVGTLDEYVAWFFDPPSDLEHRARYAIGSGKYSSELEAQGA